MIQNLLISINAIIPFTFYVMAGYAARRFGWADESLMNKLNTLIFKSFFPFMMFYNIYGASFSFGAHLKLLITGFATVLLLLALLILIVPRLVKENAKRGVIIQGIYRSNILLLAIPLTENLFGTQGAQSATFLIAFIVPLYNVAAVVLLEHYAGHTSSFLGLIGKLFQNPLILGAVFGALAKVCHIVLPACIEKPVSVFSSVATPMGLFVLGGTLYFSQIGKNLKYLVPALTVKLIVLPALSLFVIRALCFSGVESFIYFTLLATPVAASSFPMAQNMGGDGELAGQFVFVSTVASAFTLFSWIFALKTMGII